MAVRKSAVQHAEQDPNSLPDPYENAKPQDYKDSFNKDRPMTKFVDPCKAASKASMDCLDKNNYDRDKCLEYFQAYRDCKKAWMEQRKADRRAGRA
ncbi:hypothetical protein QCA50_010635 [Cerrena zonata]|uniref:Cytochrome c oxidase-assembly factor COX23, mitochondrial n=1 Tax=Cerrena zonata TaxID=2478898 RepID=A0AAW0G079_9APHY